MPAHHALPADATIGDRLRRLRAERALTQESLAERAGLSVDMVKKLEQGRRTTARLTTLAALANALDVPLSSLTDRRPRLDGSGDRLVLGLRDVLLTPSLLPGMDADDAGEPTSDELLWQQIRTGWGHYWGGRFADLARMVPGLIGEARHAAVPGPLSQAYQLCACLLVHLGREDLATLGAERGIAAARAGDDELQWATLHGTYSWTLMMQGRYAAAEQLAIGTAGMIEPRFSTALPEHLVVWGGLILWGMAAAVEDGRGETAVDHIRLARVAAARMDADRHDYETNFGPSQVAMQTTYTYALLHQPDKALTAARDVHRRDLPTISYGRHLLDVALAHADARRYGDAETTLQRARDLAPTWFRHQPPARELVAELAEHQSRLSPVLRGLVGSLGPH